MAQSSAASVLVYRNISKSMWPSSVSFS